MLVHFRCFGLILKSQSVSHPPPTKLPNTNNYRAIKWAQPVLCVLCAVEEEEEKNP